MAQHRVQRWRVQRGPRGRALLLFGGAGLPGAAVAHAGAGVSGGFLAGVLHPVTGLDHLLAMVAVGIWGAFLGRPLIWALPVAFPLVMVIGGILGIAGVPLSHVEFGIALSVIALGCAIAAAWRAPVAAALALVGVFAIFHGYAHGRELPAAASPAAFAAGFVLSTGLLHLTGIGIGLLERLPGGTGVLRVTGAIIAALGVWILFGQPPLV